MVKFSFSEIEAAFMYVSSAMYGMNSAVLCKDTGKILYRSDMAGIDEIEDEEDLDWDQCVEVPHKNDLDLGRNLVFEFVEEYLPSDYESVRQIFRRQGSIRPLQSSTGATRPTTGMVRRREQSRRARTPEMV